MELDVNRKFPLKKFLTVILIFTIIIASTVLLTAYLPAIKYYLFKPNKNQVNYPVSEILAAKLNVTSTNTYNMPNENRLIVPAIAVDTEIIEGDDLKVLETQEGAWRFPRGKNPTQLGNMTIAGHRFQYLPPNTSTFYNLDKLEVSDKIFVIWNKHYYVYNIYKIFEVDPHEVYIEEDDDNHPREITLYTCTPLGTTAKRLVVKADLEFEE